MGKEVDGAAVSSVSIRPEVTILSVLRHLNYKPWFALAEFVDNSIQSAQQNKSDLQELHGDSFRLRVEIEVDRALAAITIRDNATGIRAADFPRAFRPAELPPERNGLSEFGMGMKSAACWFTNNWQVRTKAIGERVERLVDFDIETIIAAKSESISVEEIEAPLTSHYTEVRLRELGAKLPQTKTWKKLRDHLVSIYRVFLRSGELELIFEGENLKYEEPEVLVSPHYRDPTGSDVCWRKPIDFDFGSGLSVKGFAALRKTGSTTHAGFALFRRGRLIEGSGDETYRPSEVFGYADLPPLALPLGSS